MSIVHLNIPAFAVAVERRVDSRLRDCPMAVAAGSAPRAPVIAVSAEAYQCGIRAGDRAVDALKQEPRLRIVPQNPPLYERAQAKLWQVVERFTPIFEPARLGSFYLDMSGMESLFGKAPEAAGKIHREVREGLGLIATLGVAENKLVSRIAAQVIRPQGLCDVFPGSELVFLAPLGVDYLPGIGELTQNRLLRELGVRRIRDLAAVPAPVLTKIFGSRGALLRDQARGIDEDTVCPARRPLILAETANLSRETNDEGSLLAELWNLVESLAADLRRRGLVAGSARLDGLYLDHRRTRREVALMPPMNLDFQIFGALEAAWLKFLGRRRALKSFSLRFSGLQPEFRQSDFFSEAREEDLFKTLDRLRAKYGRGIVRSGRALK